MNGVLVSIGCVPMRVLVVYGDMHVIDAKSSVLHFRFFRKQFLITPRAAVGGAPAGARPGAANIATAGFDESGR